MDYWKNIVLLIGIVVLGGLVVLGVYISLNKRDKKQNVDLDHHTGEEKVPNKGFRCPADQPAEEQPPSEVSSENIPKNAAEETSRHIRVFGSSDNQLSPGSQKIQNDLSKKPATPNRKPPQDQKENLLNDLLKKLAAIYSGESEIASPKNLCLMEQRAKYANDAYYLMREIKQDYWGESGVENVLRDIVALAAYVPDGIRAPRDDRMPLPLLVAVWHTYISTLKRKCQTLSEKAQKLQTLLTKKDQMPEEELAALKKEINDIFTPCKEDVNRRNVSTYPKHKETMARFLDQYQMRISKADTTLSDYEALVSEEAVEKHLALCRDLQALVDGDRCLALNTADPATDRPNVTVSMVWNGREEAVELSAETYDYWLKLDLFAKEIHAFEENWNESSF